MSALNNSASGAIFFTDRFKQSRNYTSISFLSAAQAFGNTGTMSQKKFQDLAKLRSNVLERGYRLYFDEPSFSYRQKREIEFAIKMQLSEYFDTSFRSIAIAGSSHLGFSPYKGTDFTPGTSDLDIAIIDAELFQRIWRKVAHASRGFTDNTCFRNFSNAEEASELLRERMSRRAMILSDGLPLSPEINKDRDFLNRLGQKYREMFASISVAFYINEYAFSWKQNSAIQNIQTMEIK